MHSVNICRRLNFNRFIWFVVQTVAYLCICWHNPAHICSFDGMDSQKRTLLQCTYIFLRLETYSNNKKMTHRQKKMIVIITFCFSRRRGDEWERERERRKNNKIKNKSSCVNWVVNRTSIDQEIVACKRTTHMQYNNLLAQKVFETNFK